MANKRVHKRQLEADSPFFNHESRLLSIVVRFTYNVWMSILEDSVVASKEAFGDQHPDLSPEALFYGPGGLLVKTKLTGISKIYRHARPLGVNSVVWFFLT